jgi:hypothetical protein
MPLVDLNLGLKENVPCWVGYDVNDHLRHNPLSSSSISDADHSMMRCWSNDWLFQDDKNAKEGL